MSAVQKGRQIVNRANIHENYSAYKETPNKSVSFSQQVRVREFASNGKESAR